MLNGLFAVCVVSLPFLIKGPKMRENLVVFFSKGILSTLIDTYVVESKRIEYPVRPFPKVFKTNIRHLLLIFFCLLLCGLSILYGHLQLPFFL